MKRETQFIADVVAATTSGTGGANELRATEGVFYLNVTAASGTTPTLNVDIEEQDPNGVWHVVLSFAQATAVSKQRVISPSPASNGAPAPGGLPGAKYRAAYTIGGTTPSFSFSVSFSGLG